MNAEGPSGEAVGYHKFDCLMYLQGVPAAPMCGFSQLACRILDHYGEIV